MNWLDHKVLRSPSLDSTKVVLHLSDKSMVVVAETMVEVGVVGASSVGRWETLIGQRRQ